MSVKSGLPLIVIVGPTASGKSALAMEMAAKFQGEIICADSRTVYRQMDIGTAKPDENDKGSVLHWGIDLINPDERFSASDFKKYAVKKIDEIRNRGHVPFLVGGTGLYVDSVIFDYQFAPKADPNFRAELEKHSIDQLREYCKNNNVILPQNEKNKRHLIRAIETKDEPNRLNTSIIDNCIVVGITTEKSVLLQRISSRIHQMINAGVIDEAKQLGEKYGWDIESMKSNIYPLIKKYIDGLIDMDQLVTSAITTDWRLAKRQITWLKRNKFIHWDDINGSKEYIEKYLAHIR